MTSLVITLSRLFSKLSCSGVLRAGALAGWLAARAFRFRRREVVASIRRSFPEKPPEYAPAVADRMYRHLGIFLVEFLRAGALTPAQISKEVLLEDCTKIFSALSGGKGLLVLTAHVGNFELLAMAAALKGVPLTIVAKTLKPEWLNRWWFDTRSAFGVRTLPSRNSYRKCLDVLGSNGVLAFVLDQNMNKYRGIFVDFFGRPACTSPGLALLSARSGASVLPVFTLRGGDGRHRIRFLDLIPPPGKSKEAIKNATQHYTGIIEDFIRTHPEQWIWLHRRWRTQPGS